MFPVSRNTIFLRVENIADRVMDLYSYTVNQTTAYLALQDFAQSLFENVNHGVTLNNINI
jgi:hypothetical protein